jgi:hypothetical protein
MRARRLSSAWQHLLMNGSIQTLELALKLPGRLRG